MKLFKTEGEISAYLPKDRLLDGITLFFSKKKLMNLQLNLAHSAIISEDCGLKKDEVLDWLWDIGYKAQKNSEVQDIETVTITSYDIKAGKLITPFKQLRRDPNLHL